MNKMDEYIQLDRVIDAQLIQFCRKSVSRNARKILGLKLGFLKAGPYKVRKVNYPILIQFYLNWLPGDRSGILEVRKSE
jgi:hypothetical protein